MMANFVGKQHIAIQEDIKILDKEISELDAKFESSGISKEKKEQLLQPVIRINRKVLWKNRGKKLLFCLFLAAAIFGLEKWKVSNRLITVATRKVLVDVVLPFYDWTWLWEDECIYANPYFVPVTIYNPLKCQLCKNRKNLTQLRKVSTTYMSKAFTRMLPAHVVDAMGDWPSIVDPLTPKKLKRMYSHDPIFTQSAPCDLMTSSGFEEYPESVAALFEVTDELLDLEEEGNYTAYWSNCDQASFRAFHKFYYQPYFLPGMCEPTRDLNYVLMGRKSSRKTGGVKFLPAADEVGYWIAGVYGEMEILLKMKKRCAKVCENLRVVLKKGEMLNVPNKKMYSMSFRPASEEAIAIASGYTYK